MRCKQCHSGVRLFDCGFCSRCHLLNGWRCPGHPVELPLVKPNARAELGAAFEPRAVRFVRGAWVALRAGGLGFAASYLVWLAFWALALAVR